VVCNHLIAERFIANPVSRLREEHPILGLIWFAFQTPHRAGRVYSSLPRLKPMRVNIRK
jgi:hypothetical protein